MTAEALGLVPGLAAAAKAGEVFTVPNPIEDDASWLRANGTRPLGREIPAETILRLLTGESTDAATGSSVPAHVHGRGVRIRGAWITGPMDWDWQQLKYPLVLQQCRIDQQINLDHAHVQALSLIGCTLKGVSAEQLTSASTLVLVRSTVAGSVQLRDAHINGALLVSGTRFEGDEPGKYGRTALNGARMQVTGTVVFTKARAEGAIELPGAVIGGNLVCRGATFTNPPANALQASDCQVAGSVMLNDGFIAEGRLAFERARVTGNLSCEGATLTSHAGQVFTANRAQVGGVVDMSQGFSATGEVNLVGARVGGNWDCSGGSFAKGSSQEAIWASDAKIEGTVLFSDGFQSHGRIRILSIQTGGNLNCSRSTMANPGNVALLAVNADIASDIDCYRAAVTAGETSFVGAKVGGNVSFARAQLSNPKGVVLNLADITVDGNISLTAGFRAEGEVNLQRAEIGARLTCQGNFVKPEKYAIFAESATIKAGVRLNQDAVVDGSVRLTAATISGPIIVQRATVTERFEVDNATVSGTFRWRELSGPPPRTLDLRGAHVGELDDDDASWPEPGGLLLSGFTYSRISDRAPRTPKQRIAWIRRQPGYAPEPYQQLAAVYRGAGEESEATQVAMEQKNDLLARGDLTRPSRAWMWFLGKSIGHGYRPGRAAWAMLVLYLVTVVSVWLGARNDGFIQVGDTAPQPSVTASHCGDAYPCLSVPAYALENITPILNLHQAENWQPKSSDPGEWILRDWLSLTTVVGYAVTTLLAAGLTGLARRT